MDTSTEEAIALYQVAGNLAPGIAAEAIADADRVSAFLEAFFDVVNEEYPELALAGKWRTMLSARFLRELAAALRLLEWETSALVSPAMELPPALETLESVIRDIAITKANPTLNLEMLRVFVEFFAWNGREDVGASVVLDGLCAEDLADQIAKFLWKHRNDLEMIGHVESTA